MDSCRRAILITLDGAGIGALPDAAAYGDAGTDTLGHAARACGGLKLPTLQRLGLGNLHPIPGVPPVASPAAAWGRMAEASPGKDTTTGHWELAGLIRCAPFPTFPTGFPDQIITAFRRETGLSPLGNLAASGTEIIARLGEEHLATGRPIVYTSVDSVFQIAAHEGVIPPEKLYRLCRTARRILDPLGVARVIARPFVGSPAEGFRRTPRRHDFSLPPTGPTLLDRLVAAGLEVHGVGKIADIFAGRGITRSTPTTGDADGMEQTLVALGEMSRGLVFANLVDFDMLYGHRRDPEGFGRALEAFDRWLPSLLGRLAEDDLLLITADHGCDPTATGTDHTREYVPLLAWRKGIFPGRSLGERCSFADVAATLGAALEVAWTSGTSFWGELGGGISGRPGDAG